MTNFSLNGLRSVGVLAAIMAITACGTISEVDSQGHTKEPIFPEAKSASRPDGSYVNLENLGKIRPGMTKKQIQELIGHPQFAEGMFAVREWDYILKFRQANGEADKVCQYKVLFDDEMLAQSFFFKPTDCIEPVVAAQEQPKTKSVMLAADATFGFDSAVLEPAGRETLRKFVRDLNETDVSAIEIVGHTDRFGSAQHNRQLSLARANSVRAFLEEHGVAGSMIKVDGQGSADPLVTCPGAQSAEVIKCLAPNRRTVISVHFD